MKNKWIYLLVICVSFGISRFVEAAEDPIVEKEIPISPAMLTSSVYMLFDDYERVLYLFDPYKKAEVNVVPRQGWSWERKNPNASGSRKLKPTTTVKLYPGQGENPFSFKIQYSDIILYIVLDRYIGLDATDGGSKEVQQKARLLVVPGNFKAELEEDSIEWTRDYRSRYSFVGVNKSACEVKGNRSVGILAGEPSPSDGAEGLSVKAFLSNVYDGIRNGKRAQVRGSARFTIVKVNVELDKLSEDEEEKPGCVEGPVAGSSGDERKITFFCQPSSLKEDFGRFKINLPAGCRLGTVVGANAFQHVAKDGGEVGLSQLQNRELTLQTDGPVAGEIKISHIASVPNAVDKANYLCWGMKLVEPLDVKDPIYHTGSNDVCYKEGRCTVPLKVKVLPDSAKDAVGLTAAYLNKNYQGVFTAEDISGKKVKVEKEWTPAEGKGVWQDDGEELVCSSKLEYVGLPDLNSSFGPKIVKFNVKGKKQSLSTQIRVFYEKFGNDHPACEHCPGCANWFYYWRQGAVPGLNAAYVYYDNSLGVNVAGLFDPETGSIRVSDEAAKDDPDGELTIYKYASEDKTNNALSRESKKIGVGSNCCGVAYAASTVLHEECHKSIREKSKGKLDSDGDGVADDVEGLFGMVTYTKRSASYNFLSAWENQKKRNDKESGSIEKAYEDFEKEYKDYVDNEIRARLAQREYGKKYDSSKDWARPGCQGVGAFKYGPADKEGGK